MTAWLRYFAPGACALWLVFPSPAQDVAVLPEVQVTSRPYIPHSNQFSAQSNLVEARVVVRDVHGHPIAGLPRSVFRLLVDGKPVAFTGFWVETAAAMPLGAAAAGRGVPDTATAVSRPRAVALFMDDLSLDRVAVAMARNAARKLQANDLAGDIRLGVFTSSGAVALPFTSDSAAWDQAIAKLQFRARMPPQGIISGTNFSPELAYWIQQSPSMSSPFYKLAAARMQQAGLCSSFAPEACWAVVMAEADATVQAAEDNSNNILDALQRAIAALSGQPGDHVLLLTSTGFFADTMMPRLEEVARQALRDNVVIDALDAKLLDTEPPEASAFEHMMDWDERGALNAPLATLAADTGGELFQNDNDLAGALRRLASQPEVAYALSFTPAALPYDGKFHKLKVEVATGKHADVQTRKGYYDPAPEDDLYRAATPAAVDAAVLGPLHADDLPLAISTEWAGNNLRVNVRLSPARLHFSACDDERRCEDLVFTSAVFDAQGRFITGKTGAMGLELTHGGFATLAKTGLGANLNLHLRAGAYRVREVVQEGNRGDYVALDKMVAAGSH